MIEPLQYRVDDASCIVCACIPVGLNQLRNVGKNIYCKLQHTHTHTISFLNYVRTQYMILYDARIHKFSSFLTIIARWSRLLAWPCGYRISPLQARPYGQSSYPASTKAFSTLTTNRPWVSLSLQVDRICLSFRNTFVFPNSKGRICV